MTDEQIIKALKCCFSDDFEKCEDCPLKNKKDVIFSCIYIKQKLTLDLINRQSNTINALEGLRDVKNAEIYKGVIKLLEKDVNDQQPLKEEKQGEWQAIENSFTTVAGISIKGVTEYRCSVCGHREIFKYPYCNCGAKMKGAINE